ncbi:MAG TPA: hypothetical protein VHE32_11630 [Rhodanobacteraceae bacterium]|jgi:hypothetical protein|nr:hypothetical protein [Rhodanobacteraceae bacterium]
MSSIVVEAFNPEVHRNHMPEVPAPAVPHKVLVVVVGRFRLEFLSSAQLEAAIAYFRSPSETTRMPAGGGDHWEFQRWQSRLPAGINNSHNRPKVLAALDSARAVAQAQLS